MASRSQAKFVLRLGLMAVVGVFGLVALSFLSRAMADITRSEETAAIFNVAAELDHELVEAVEWLPDVPGLPRQLPPLDREALTDTWLRAWAQLLILSDGSGPVGSSVEGAPTDGIDEYFGGSAAEAMMAGAQDWLGLPVHQIGHDLRLTFYSDDGSVASVTSERSRFLRAQPVGDGIQWYDTTESYDAVFVLEDGNWRIHHWVRRSSDGRWANELSAAPPVAFELDEMRSVTWRPATQTLEEFWTDPDLVTTQAEFAAIGPLGFNTVRIELPFEEVGGRAVSPTTLFPALAVLEIAQENGLRVVFSLLSGRTEHQPLHWDADDDHLATVATVLGSHPALALWELSAQPDLHIGVERVDESLLHAWLSHIARTLRSGDSDTPITIGWASTRAALEAPPIADVISFSWDGDATAVATDLDDLRTVAEGRPIVIADASRPTFVGLLPGGSTETEQARYFADMLLAARDLGLNGFNVSALRDFDVETVAARAQEVAEAEEAAEQASIDELELQFPPPPTPEPTESGPEVHEAPVVAEVVWPTGADAAVGLLRVDGTPKPAAAVFAPDADLDAVPAPSLIETLRKPFNMILVVLLLLALGAWAFLAYWARNKLPIPHLRRRTADGKHAQRRGGRTRKKTSVTAHIEHPQTPTTPIEAPPASADVEEPSGGRLRRVLNWFNEPVAGDDIAAVEVAAPVGQAPVATAAAVPAQPAAPAPVQQMPLPVADHPLAAPVAAAPVVPAMLPVADPPLAVMPSATPPVAPVAAAPLAQPAPYAAQSAQVMQHAVPVAAEAAYAPAPAPAVHPGTAPAHAIQPVAPAVQAAQFTAPPAHPVAAVPEQHQAATPPAQAFTAPPASPAVVAPNEISAAQQAQFQAWLASQSESTPAPTAPAVSAQAPAPAPTTAVVTAAPATPVVATQEPAPAADAPAVAEPTETLAEALPSWPSEKMFYDDVHSALFGVEGAAPTASAISMVEVDLQAIDVVAEQADNADIGVVRYAPFLMRALCMTAQHFGGDAQPVHISINGAGIKDRRVADAHAKRLSALAAELSAAASTPEGGPTPTVTINLSSSANGRMSLDIGGSTTPTISLVYLGKRPVTTRDQFGCIGVSTHSMGLLSITASTTSTGADGYLNFIRELLETRDWTTELG